MFRFYHHRNLDETTATVSIESSEKTYRKNRFCSAAWTSAALSISPARQAIYPGLFSAFLRYRNIVTMSFKQSMTFGKVEIMSNHFINHFIERYLRHPSQLFFCQRWIAEEGFDFCWTKIFRIDSYENRSSAECWVLSSEQ